MAEYYAVHDMTAYPVQHIAVLAAGLPDTSRTKTRTSGNSVPDRDILLAYIADKTALTAWLLSSDGQSGDNRPVSMVGALLGEQQDKRNSEADTVGFDSPADFHSAWASIVGG